MNSILIRNAERDDLEAIREIYNQGIEDRLASLDGESKTVDEMIAWWDAHDARYAVIVAVDGTSVIGWSALNRFSHRCAHAEIADLSVYVRRDYRGQGVGAELLRTLHERARTAGFHKIVLHALDRNESGKRLYRKMGYTHVGTFREHGFLDGAYVDIVAMEKLLGDPHP